MTTTKRELAERLLELSAMFAGLPESHAATEIIDEYDATLEAYVRLVSGGIH
ncbi:hypothetical protein [Microbacterium testaceum]|uniref:hypothetical protein n=1 Tax=Microbacterium testaceum TaxID=2033 RepID=UPI0022E5D7B8|nr:hypothetical protein [Microbacterium testaceum]